MLSKTRTTIAALAASFVVAAVAAAPANATDNSGTSSKKGCSVTLSTGQGIIYDHGYSFSVKNKATGKTHTYTCNDGKWEETVAFTPGVGGRPFAVVTEAFVKASGALVVVSPQRAHTVVRNGRYHAAP